MNALELGVGNRGRDEEAIGAEGSQEVDPGTEPAGRQRVMGPEVVMERRGAVDHQGLGLFRFRIVHGPSVALLRAMRGTGSTAATGSTSTDAAKL